MASSVLSSGPRISQTERWQISDQLTRVLISPWFRTSSRCSQLLRHTVELAIHGQIDRLRERQIAIEAFHRKPTYDNNTDPVVRVAAGEVRKRLAQYYSDPENAGQIRFELPIGSYVPVFHFPDQQIVLPEPELSLFEPENELAAEMDAVPEDVGRYRALQPQPLSPRRIALFALLGVLVLTIAALGAWRTLRPASTLSGFDAFWAPVLAAQKTPLISVGELSARELTFVPNPQRNHRTDGFKITLNKAAPQGIPVERIAYSQAAARIASLFGAKNRTFDMLDQSETTFADFSNRPTILLGSFDNDWAVGISEGKRFQFESARGLKWIADRDNPGMQIGVLETTSLEPTTYDAFSIVMRQTGLVSQQPHVLLAGIGDKGTVAAAEFVSNPKYLDDFGRHAPMAWASKNIEFLIRTRVIEDVVGIPTIVDYKVW